MRIGDLRMIVMAHAAGGFEESHFTAQQDVLDAAEITSETELGDDGPGVQYQVFRCDDAFHNDHTPPVPQHHYRHITLSESIGDAKFPARHNAARRSQASAKTKKIPQ